MPGVTKHKKLLDWVNEWAKVLQPSDIRWCDGTDVERAELCGLLVQSGTFVPLAAAKRPNSFLARSDPADVARVEDRTFICSETESDAGPTNRWDR